MLPHLTTEFALAYICTRFCLMNKKKFRDRTIEGRLTSQIMVTTIFMRWQTANLISKEVAKRNNQQILYQNKQRNIIVKFEAEITASTSRKIRIKNKTPSKEPTRTK